MTRDALHRTLREYYLELAQRVQELRQAEKDMRDVGRAMKLLGYQDQPVAKSGTAAKSGTDRLSRRQQEILDILRSCEAPLDQIAKQLNLHKTGVSKHITKLKRKGLVKVSHKVDKALWYTATGPLLHKSKSKAKKAKGHIRKAQAGSTVSGEAVLRVLAEHEGGLNARAIAEAMNQPQLYKKISVHLPYLFNKGLCTRKDGVYSLSKKGQEAVATRLAAA